jgi:hypothetical protein
VRFIDDCGMFLYGSWAAKAAALGWGPFELFGCNRHKPFARIDHMGLLWLLNGRKLIALTADSAAIGTPSGSPLTFHRKTETGVHQTYHRRSEEVTDLVLAWELEE